jgi:hypothetical protein
VGIFDSPEELEQWRNEHLTAFEYPDRYRMQLLKPARARRDYRWHKVELALQQDQLLWVRHSVAVYKNPPLRHSMRAEFRNQRWISDSYWVVPVLVHALDYPQADRQAREQARQILAGTRGFQAMGEECVWRNGAPHPIGMATETR